LCKIMLEARKLWAYSGFMAALIKIIKIVYHHLKICASLFFIFFHLFQNPGVRGVGRDLELRPLARP
jgi:hypothetical protein